MPELFTYNFMVNALIASFLASIAAGVIGSYVVVKRIVFISGGISHSTYGGIGLGYLLGFNPILGAVGAALVTAGIVAKISRKKKQSEDMLIGIVWALGMALGIFFINLSEGYAPDLMSYLFGNILLVSNVDLVLMFILNIIVIGTVIIYYNKFLAVTFDEEFAKSVGLNTDRIYLLLLILIAITTVMLIKVVGIVLVIALISIPPAIAINYSKSIKQMMLISVILGLLFTIFGLFISYYLNLTSGASIIFISVIGYLISYFLKK